MDWAFAVSLVFIPFLLVGPVMFLRLGSPLTSANHHLQLYFPSNWISVTYVARGHWCRCCCGVMGWMMRMGKPRTSNRRSFWWTCVRPFCRLLDTSSRLILRTAKWWGGLFVFVVIVIVDLKSLDPKNSKVGMPLDPKNSKEVRLPVCVCCDLDCWLQVSWPEKQQIGDVTWSQEQQRGKAACLCLLWFGLLTSSHLTCKTADWWCHLIPRMAKR